MFPNLGMPELTLILVLALIVFGPRKLPEVGRAIGKALAQLRAASMSAFEEVNKATIEKKETDQTVTTATETIQK